MLLLWQALGPGFLKLFLRLLLKWEYGPSFLQGSPTFQVLITLRLYIMELFNCGSRRSNEILPHHLFKDSFGFLCHLSFSKSSCLLWTVLLELLLGAWLIWWKEGQAASAPWPRSVTGMFLQGWQPALALGTAPGFLRGAALWWHVACSEESCWHHQNWLPLHAGGRRRNSRRHERHGRTGEGMVVREMPRFSSRVDFFEAELGIWGCRPEHSCDSSWAAVVCLVTTIVLS